MPGEVSEALVAESLLPQLEAEGYEVFVNPTQAILPRFFGDYHPDLIALRKDHNLAIEIQRASDQEEDRLRAIVERFRDRSDWELRVIWISPGSAENAPVKQTIGEIKERLHEADRLISAAHFDVAFLLCWAILEAIGRAVLEDELRQPQTPDRLVEVLATKGVLAPEEADLLRPLIRKRNSLAHGEFNAGVSRDDAETMLRIVKAVTALVRQ